jgi:hypothetical protein
MTDSMAAALASVVRAKTKKWRKAKRREDRISSWGLGRMRTASYRTTIRDVAFKVMEDAYQKASGGGRYPANARQIYYAARPAILARADAKTLDSQYFTQTLLKDYLEEMRPAWDVVWDARGHFAEPHTDNDRVGLGGIEVRRYMQGFTDGEIGEPTVKWERLVPTRGPSLRFGGVLFVEKEGFGPLLEAAQIAERFDLAIASTKGMPVSACCDLLGALGLPVYVVRDFDKAGFSIVASLRRGTRGSSSSPATVVDLGLRGKDIEGLEREPVSYGHTNPRWNLQNNGATKAEIEVLCSNSGAGPWVYKGERVELNAMASDEFANWLEGKLMKAGVKKVLPGKEVLAAAYHRAVFLQRAEAEIERQRDSLTSDGETRPRGLAAMARRLLRIDPTLSWDAAIWQIAEADLEGTDE